MSNPATFARIADERRRLADLAEPWSPVEWATPSLAWGWTVQDVVAHLTMGFNVGLPQMAFGLVRNLGSYDRFADRWARGSSASRTPAELVDDLRTNAESRFTPPGMGPEAPLTEVVVHGLDVRIPLGLSTDDIDPAAVRQALTYLTTPAAKVFGVRRGAFDEVRLEATDVDWAHGTGPVQRATGAEILAHLCRDQPLPRT